MNVIPADALVVVAAAAAAATAITRSSRRPRRPARPAPQAPARDVVAVLVLGPVTVQRDGSPLPLTARQLELTAYLAAHPQGVNEDQLRTALWPDRIVTRGAFNNLVSNTRRALGTITGDLVLPKLVADGRYRLHGAVICDLRFIDTATTPEGDEALLRAVRGRPFSSNGEYAWADLEGLTYWADAAVSAAADRRAKGSSHDLRQEEAADTPARHLRTAPQIEPPRELLSRPRPSGS